MSLLLLLLLIRASLRIGGGALLVGLAALLLRLALPLVVGLLTGLTVGLRLALPGLQRGLLLSLGVGALAVRGLLGVAALLLTLLGRRLLEGSLVGGLLTTGSLLRIALPPG